MRAVLHTDGGARGNPGPAGIGVLLQRPDGRVIAEMGEGIGIATNNVAEYKALIAGLELALDRDVSQLQVCLDSKLVVFQLKGEWKIKKAGLRPLALTARALMKRFEECTIEHVPRELNADADRLANQGMDAAALDALQDEEMRGTPSQGSLLE